MLLPNILHGTQPSHFFGIASISFGHQKCLPAIDILLMAGCPLWRRLIIVFRRFFGTIILSSKNTIPYLVESFFLYMMYSSGMLSCCWRSKHTSVLRRLGSFVSPTLVVGDLWGNSFRFLRQRSLGPNCFVPQHLLWERDPSLCTGRF